jgi:hypothetical protein
MRYAYWGFRCRTKDCNTPLMATKIGPYDKNSQIPPLPALTASEASLEVYCGVCRQSHAYHRNEAQVLIVSEPE